jgi:hypothetical protein
MRQPDRAIAEAQEAIKLDPNFALAYDELGTAYLQKAKACICDFGGW